MGNVGKKWRRRKILAKREKEEKADPQNTSVDPQRLTQSTLNSVPVFTKGRQKESTTETRERGKREESLVMMIQLSIVMRAS